MRASEESEASLRSEYREIPHRARLTWRGYGQLSATLANITDPKVRDVKIEAITCLKVDAERACIVFAWTGAIRVIRQRMLTYAKSALNDALKKHYPNARNVTSIDHFSCINNKAILLAAQELGIFDKSEKDTLEGALNLRNRWGHPGKYNPAEAHVSSFFEDLVSLVS